VATLNDQLAADPTNIELLVKIGRIYLEYADAAEGAIRLHAALDIDPENVEARQLLSEYYASRAKADPSFQILADQYAQPDSVIEEPDAPPSWDVGEFEVD
jgi:cytochrome c-type biogenesis protein CcmH/NrfG